MATLANLLVIRALMKASTLPANVKKMLNCKKDENWGEAEGKRDDTIFSPLPLPFFPYFALVTSHGLLFLISPIFICQQKKLKTADNSLLTKETWQIAWACALEVDRRMPGDSGSGTCHTAPVDVDSRLFCTCCTCRGKT